MGGYFFEIKFNLLKIVMSLALRVLLAFFGLFNIYFLLMHEIIKSIVYRFGQKNEKGITNMCSGPVFITFAR